MTPGSQRHHRSVQHVASHRRSGLACRAAAFTLAALALAVAAAPSSWAQSRRPLRYQEMDFPLRYDPVTAKDNSQKRIVQLLFSGITTEAGKAKYVADLCASAPYPTDQGFAIVISPKPKVPWLKDPNPKGRDEEPEIRGDVRHTDVTATLSAILNPRTQNYAYPELKEYLSYINGAVETRGVEGVRLSEKLKLVLTQAVGPATERLMAFKVLPAQILALPPNDFITTGSDVGNPEKMLCTGPYWLDQCLVDEGRLVFRAYRQFHGGRPRIGEIRMSFTPDPVLIAIDLSKERCDLAPEIPYAAVADLLEQRDKFTGKDYSSFNFLYIGGNYRAGDSKRRNFIRDPRFREALSLAITDRTRRLIIHRGYGGQGAPFHDFFGPNAPYPDRSRPARLSDDDRRAKINDLLDRCGYSDESVKFTLKYKDLPKEKNWETMAKIFAHDATDCGINIEAQGVRTSREKDMWGKMKEDGDFDFIMDTYVYGQGYNLKPFFLRGEEENTLSYRPYPSDRDKRDKLDELDSAFADFEKPKQSTAHWEALKRVVDLLVADHAVVCIGSLKTTAIWRKDLNASKDKMTSEYFFNDVHKWHWRH